MVDRLCALAAFHTLGGGGGVGDFGSLAFLVAGCLMYRLTRCEWTHCGCIVMLGICPLDELSHCGFLSVLCNGAR